MTDIVTQMLSPYKATTVDEKRMALKEVIQNTILCALATDGFFSHAAFYGGTALRIFHGLDRFSEDLDFALLQKDPDYDISQHFSAIRKTLEALGLECEVTVKQKNVETYEATAYVKCKARQLLSTWYPDSVEVVPYNESMTTRLTVDTNPPGAFSCEFKALLLPSPCKIRLYDVPSLFAGKIHALLCRKWTRVKGRDIYDYIFYLSRGAGVNMRHLKEKLASSKFIESGCDIDLPWLIEVLEKRFQQIDFSQAKDDVRPFIKDSTQLDVWSADFLSLATRQYLKEAHLT